MVRPAAIDPPAVHHRLWGSFRGTRGFDVGTNCGQSLTEMARRFEVVTGFEPCSGSWELAVRDFAPIEILNLAVSDHDGEVTLALIEGEQADTGQLVSPGTHGMEWDPGDWEGRRVTRVSVPCRTLDSLAREFGRPDFIKVDTEGHELLVLRGAEGLLRGGPLNWLVEFHTSDLRRECQDLLESAGHEVEVIRHPHYPLASDMYFMHGWLRAWPAASSD